MAKRIPDPPMTLGNMRQNGVRRLAVSCSNCRHSAVVDVDGFSDDIPVPSFGPRMLCTYCGVVSCDARPNWSDAPADTFHYRPTEGAS
jgi:hypothetical protein